MALRTQSIRICDKEKINFLFETIGKTILCGIRLLAERTFAYVEPSRDHNWINFKVFVRQRKIYQKLNLFQTFQYFGRLEYILVKACAIFGLNWNAFSFTATFAFRAKSKTIFASINILIRTAAVIKTFMCLYNSWFRNALFILSKWSTFRTLNAYVFPLKTDWFIH